MHSRRKGESGSRRPAAKTAPPWVEVSKEQATELVLKFAKEGKTSAEIGGVLRDGYGVPSFKALVGNTIPAILAENGLGSK